MSTPMTGPTPTPMTPEEANETRVWAGKANLSWSCTQMTPPVPFEAIQAWAAGEETLTLDQIERLNAERKWAIWAYNWKPGRKQPSASRPAARKGMNGQRRDDQLNVSLSPAERARFESAVRTSGLPSRAAALMAFLDAWYSTRVHGP